MPLQNRVDPCGAIIRSSVRGTLMGNRGGVLHNDQREIVRPYAGRRWIACLLEFKGRKRTVMSPRRYTELFFLDEAVALAAGHRPCAECRRERYNAFRAVWKSPSPRAEEIDRELRAARIDSRRKKVTWMASLHLLPGGCFVQVDGLNYLVWDDTLLLWSPGGYLKRQRKPEDATVTVVTPEPIVECLRRGYIPDIHSFALRM